MSIGYDGRLRPASTPAIVDATQQLDPEKVGRVANAQPKFVEGVMKMFGSMEDAAKNLSVRAERVDEREAEFSAAEAREEYRQRLTQEAEAIRRNEKLTPRQRETAISELKAKYENEENGIRKTGRKHIDRQGDLYARQTLFNTVQQMYGEADRARSAAEETKFKSDVSVALLGLQSKFTELFPKWNSDGVTPDDVEDKIKEIVAEARKNIVTKGNQSREQALDAAFNGAMASAMLSYTKSYTDAKRREAATNLASTMSVFATSGLSPEETFDKMKGAVRSFQAECGMSDSEVTTHMTSGIIANAEYDITTRKENLNTELVEAASEQQAFLDSGDEEGFNRSIEESKKKIEENHKYFLDRLGIAVGQADSVIKGIKDSKQKEVAEKWLASEKKRREKEINDWKQQADIQLTHSTKAKRRDTGVAAAKGLRDTYNGKGSGKLEGVALSVYNLLTPDPETANAQSAKYQGNPAALDAFVAMNFKDLDSAVARNAVAMNLKYAITQIENPGEGENLFDVEKVLVSAAELLGFDSDDYKEVARFAIENIKKEKNNVPSDEKKEFLRGIFGSDFNDLSGDEKKRYFRIRSFIDEVSDEEFAKYRNERSGVLVALKNDLESERRYDLIFTPGMFGEGVANALKSAEAVENGMPTPKLGIGPVGETNELKKLMAGEELAILNAKLLYETKGGASIAKYREDELNRYWYGAAKELGVKLPKWLYAYEYGTKNEVPVKGMGMTVRKLVLEELNRRENEKRDKEERPKLADRMMLLGLPFDRRAYTSFWGAGGYAINSEDEIELGINPEGRKELTVEEMREILRQYDFYMKKRSEENETVENLKEEIERKKAELKKLEGGKK